jgi:hypothetical protein
VAANAHPLLERLRKGKGHPLMHDPSHLLIGVRVGPIRLDIWHDDPDDADAFTVCGMSPETGWERIWWGVRHARHLHYRFWPYLKIKRWVVDRCAECGRGFLWKDSRGGYMGSDDVYHGQCMTLRMTRGMLDDLTGYVRGTADSNTRWRAKYRLKKLDGHEDDE